MAQNMFGSALNPQNVVPLDINTSTSYAATLLPPYQNVSSGSYLLQNINPLSDTVLQTTDRGNLNTLYYSFSTMSQVIIGTPSSFVLQNKNDFNYFPLATRLSPFANGGIVNTVVWNGTIWVAGGLQNQSIVTAASATGLGVLYTLASSTDGLSWVPRDSGQIFGQDPYTANNGGVVYGLAWNGSLWVAVGAGATSGTAVPGGNVVATSPDGITWTGRGSFLTYQQGNPTTAPTTGAKCAVGGYLLMAPTANNPPASGLTLALAPGTSSVTLIGQSAAGVNSVTYPYYFSTVDGLNLQRYQFPVNQFAYAAWSGELWCAVSGVASSAFVFTSTDGINWTQRAIAASSITQVFSVAWSPILSLWVICGAGATSFVQYSYDTITWTAGTGGPGTALYDVVWVSAPLTLGGTPQNVFVAVGAGATLYYSTNGTSWAQNTNVSTGNYGASFQLNSVVFAPSLGLWFAGGSGGTPNSVIYGTTYNGAWITATNNSLALMTNVYQLAWSQTLGLLVAVGGGNNTNSIINTVNGATWVAVAGTGTNFLTPFTGFSGGGTGVVFNIVTNVFIATGSGVNNFLTSTDGFNWTPFGSTGVDSIGRGVTWSPLLNQWVMVGTGNHAIATSSNGINWVGRTYNSFFNPGNAITWCPGLNVYVAVGAPGSGTLASTLITSTNGINWVSRLTASNITAFTTSGAAVFYNGTVILAGGTGGSSFLASSPDSVNWTARAATGVTGGVTAIAYSPLLQQWLVGGNSGTNAYLYSANITAATTFVSGSATGVPTGSNGILTIAWNPVGNYYLLGGQTSGTTQAPLSTSNDGLLFFNFNSLQAILTTVYCIAYNGSLWVAGGTGGTYSIAASLDGLTWFGQVAIATITTVYGIAWNGWTNVGGAQPWIPIATNGVGTGAFTWIAVGTGGSNVMVTSTNATFTIAGTGSLTTTAMTWTGIACGTLTTGFAVIWYPYQSVWVATGAGSSTIIYNLLPAGTGTWTAGGGTLISGGSPVGRALAFGYVGGGGLLVAVGTGTTHCYAYSITGVTWTGNGSSTFQGTGSAGFPSTAVFGLMTNAFGIAYSPSTYTFVVTGTGTSSGPTNQTAQQVFTQYTIINCVNPSNTTTWAAVPGATVQSTLTISSVTSVYGSVFGGGGAGTGQGNGVIWNGSMFVAVGQGPLSTQIVKAGISGPPSQLFISTVSTSATNNPSSLSTFYQTVPVSTLAGTIVPYVTEAVSTDGVNWRPAPLAPSQQQYLSVGSRYPIMVVGGQTNVNLGVSQQYYRNTLGYSADNAISFLAYNYSSTNYAYFFVGCYCVGFNGIVWFAGGNNTGGTAAQTYLLSKDGITWYYPATTFGTYPTNVWPNTAILGVAWANSLGLWCVVGYGSGQAPAIATTPDGVNWTGRGGVNATAGTLFYGGGSGSANAVAWNGTFFVVIGNAGTAASNASVVYSKDGVSWAIAATASVVAPPTAGTTALSATPPAPNTASIAWNGNVWVLVSSGAANTIYWSANTITWNAITTTQAVAGQASLFTFLGTPRSVTWSGSLFLVTGGYAGTSTANYGYYIATSPDGFNWTSRNMTIYAPGVVNTGGTFQSGNTYGSTGGGFLSAQGTVTTPYGITLQLNTVAWHPISQTWTIGVSDTTSASTTTGYAGIVTLSSSNLITWTIGMNNGFNGANPVRAIAWSPTRNYWVLMSSAVPSGTSNGFAIAGSLPITGIVPGALTIATSLDGVQINPICFYNGTAGTVPLASFNACTWGNGTFLAGGSVAAAGTGSGTSATFYGLYSSPDGITWTAQALTQGNAGAAPTVIYGIAWSTTLSIWVVVGIAGTTNGYMATGTSVSNITGIAQSTSFSGTNKNVYAVTTGNGYVVVAGNPGGTTNGISWSTNGTSWSNYSGTTTLIPTTAIYAAVYFNYVGGTPAQYWIVGGAGTTALSYTAANVPSGTWVAVGTSTNAANMTSVFALATNNNAAGGATIVVAVGTGTSGSIAYSINGTTWTAVSNSLQIFATGYSVAWNGSMFVAGGDLNAQATSPDGINWSVRKVFASSINNLSAATTAANINNAACYALTFPTREKTFTVNNAQWTGRTSQQNFRVIG